ncbi:MAG: DUF2027 domain-containing protein [Muribaculaceae bacterium]|nr:DUF2027 domain-containing protein [Muribaculaceae bacterium]
MAQVNDIVRFLNQTGGGRITRIVDNMAYVEDEDGFEQPALLRECIVVESAKPKPTAYDKPIAPLPSKEIVTEAPKPAPVIETKEGDTLNIVLAYEPREIKHLNTTLFDAYLVNDSNYYLYFSYMTRSDSDDEWVTRYHDIVEPNIQVHIEEFDHSLLTHMDRVAVQYIAFKQEKGFKLKNPALVELRLNTTKFYKMHCFHENEYFDSPVISLDIVKNDRPARMMTIDSADLERAMKEKRHQDFRPARTPVKKTEKPKKGEIIECDLHINELLDTTAGLSNKDMLEVQLDEFRKTMNENINRKGAKIVFIHGKGEGVLRKAILDELKRKYPRCEAQDASFREYGFGATLITVRG